MIRAVFTAFGAPGAETLHEVVSGYQHADVFAPVTVVVPTFAAGLFARRSLGGQGNGIANVTTLTVAQLAEHITGAELMAQGRRPAGHAVVAAALRRVLTTEPGRFGPVAGHPATVGALTASFTALAQMDEHGKAAFAARSAEASDVTRICETARRHLAETGWFDVADLIEEATATVRRPGGAARLAGLGGILGYLLSTVTAPGIDLLRAIGRTEPVTLIVPITGELDVDRAPLDLLGRLGVADTLPTRLAANESRPPSRIVSAADPDDEVRGAVQRLLVAIQAGTPPGQQAILYSVRKPYALLLRQHLAAAGVPVSGPSPTTLATTLVGRVVAGLLKLEQSGFSREAVCDLLVSAPLRAKDGSPLPVAAWEAVSRRAGVVGGRTQWAARLARFATARRADAGRYEHDDEQAHWLADRARRDADLADGFAAWLADLGDRLLPEGVPKGWAGKARWLGKLLADYLGHEQLRSSWPDHEIRAAEVIEGLVAGLAALDSLDPDPSLETFRRVVDRELNQPAPNGSVPLGRGVLVGPIGLAIGANLARVDVVGLVEGLFPGRAANDALLPDPRDFGDGASVGVSHRTSEQHRQLRGALASAGEVVLSHPVGDPRRSRVWQRSRWLAFPPADRDRDTDRDRDSKGEDAPVSEFRRSFAAGVATDPVPIDPADAELQRRYRQWLRGDPAAVTGGVGRPALVAGLGALSARRSADFTRWDGNVGGLDLAQVSRAVPQSPTRLEAYARCPHAYFMDYVLRVVPPELPEELDRISPLESGQLLHRALEHFLRECSEVGDVPGTWDPIHRDRLATIGAALCDDVEAQGLSGRPLLWRMDRQSLLADLDRFLGADSGHRLARGVTPWLLEYRFEAAELTLPSGRRLQLRGAIDRVDAGSGRVVVIDYKSGRGDDYVKIDQGDPVRGGTALQLPLYGLVVAELARRQQEPAPVVEVAYWLISHRGGNRLWSYELDEARLARCLEAVGVIVDGIEAGLFPARPPERDPFTGFVPCRFCNPDGLGTSQARNRWERKRESFELAAYKRLVEDQWQAS